MTTEDPERCPACGARLAPAAQWCSLCLTPVAGAPDEPGPADPPALGPPAGQGPLVPGPPASRDEAAAEAAADRLLAELHADSARQHPLGTRRLARSPRGVLVGLGVLLAVAASAVVVGLLWLVGMAL